MEEMNHTIPTQTPPPITPSRTNSLLKVLLFVFVIILAAAVGYIGHDYVKEFLSPTVPAVPITETAKPAGQTDTNTKDQSNFSVDDLPAIVFQPDTFTTEEKAELYKKVINPIVDYEVADANRIMVALVVEKLQPATLNYKYKISQFYTNNGWGGFLYGNGETGEIPQWVPSCMVECAFTPEYKKQHPEVIDAYNKQR